MPRIFRRIDLLFWLVWIALPFLMIESAGVSPADLLQGARPPGGLLRDLLDPLDPGAKRLFWINFFYDFSGFALALGMAHYVIHRAARGHLFAAEILHVVRLMGWLLLVTPLFGLILDNLVAAGFARVPGGEGFLPVLVPDIVVMGFGLFLLCIAAALREAIRLREDADLTI